MTRPHRYRAMLALTVVAILGACAGPDVADPIDPTPTPVDSPAPAGDVSQARLPLQLDGMHVVDPNWDTAPQHADGVFLAPGQDGEALTFTAVDDRGTVAWTARRPASCSGFALSTDTDGHALAVLTDIATTHEALAGTTATAYDLRSGEQLWGPVELPGPYYGPGLVFAAPPDGAMGATGPRVALNPTTGEVVADETDPGTGHIVGEYRGVLVLANAGDLIARDATTGAERWRRPLAELGWNADEVRAAPDHAWAGDAPALLGDPETGYALIDLTTGKLIADRVDDAITDPASGTHIVRRGQQLSGVAPDGDELWHEAVSEDLELVTAGGVLAYLRQGDGAIQVLNVLTGETAQAYPPDTQGPLAIPEALNANGTGVLRLNDNRLLAALTPAQVIPEG